MVVKEPKKISVGIVLSWIIGIVFVLGGFGALFSKELIGALALFIMGSVLIPPLNRFVSNKIKFELSSKRIKALIIIIGFVIIAVFIDSEETTPLIQETANQQEISTQPSITQANPIETSTNKPTQQSGKIVKLFEGDTAGGFDIGEDKVVFQGTTEDNNKFTTAIYLYDIATDKVTRITYDNSGKKFPTIEGNEIFWLDDRTHEGSTIWVYNLDKQKEEKTNLDVVEYLESEVYGSCYDNRCVYTDTVGSGRVDLFLKYENEITKITNDTYIEQKHPYIWKNKVVWSENRNGKNNWDIFMYDIGTNEETQITFTQDSSEFYPSIYGDYIVYQRSADERSIHLYNLKTKEDKKIPGKASLLSENPLKIYDNKVVWRTCKNDWCADEEIYIYLI